MESENNSFKAVFWRNPKPISGSVEKGDYQHIGYFEQEIKTANYNIRIEEVWNEFPHFTQYEIRAALAKCGLTTKHIESKVEVLSGGEKSKSSSM